MAFTTLISPEELQSLMNRQARLMVFDCSFELTDVAAGEKHYQHSHIPGSVYAHLDRALSEKGLPDQEGHPQVPSDAASGGRHPLPSRERFATWLSSVGFDNDMQAVVYDRNGANYCGRLWWMLKWAGHDAVAVLDGGLQAWIAAGGAATDRHEVAHFQTNFRLGPPLRKLVDANSILTHLNTSAQTLIDARAAPRYRGEVEPLDPVAGHIPGALNRPFPQNLDANGKFKSAQQLRQEFDALLAGRDPATAIHQCGSGVSAIPNLLAMEVAGLGQAALYAGSWSDWCSDPSRPVARG